AAHRRSPPQPEPDTTPRRDTSFVCDFIRLYIDCQTIQSDSIPMDLITPREAARQLGVSYPTLKQWIYKGTVRTRPTAGGHHRIPASEVDRLLAVSGEVPRTRRRRAGGKIVVLSGRNQLRGFVEEVRVEGLLAQV